MADQTIAVDPALFPGSLDAYYEKESRDVEAIKSHVQQYCTLDSAFGILLTAFKPSYDHARNQAFTTLETISGTLDSLATQALGYAKDVEANEQTLQNQITAMQAQITALQQQVTDLSSTPQGGGYSGGGGGGGGSVPPIAPTPAPAPTPTPPTTPIPDPTPTPIPTPTPEPISGINISIGGNDTGNITINVNEGAPATPTAGVDPTPGLPTDAPPASGPGTSAPGTSLIDQFWQARAEHDPLGRSAEQLEQAWLAREAITGDPSAAGLTAVGFDSGAATTMPAFFSVDPSILRQGILMPSILKFDDKAVTV